MTNIKSTRSIKSLWLTMAFCMSLAAANTRQLSADLISHEMYTIGSLFVQNSSTDDSDDYGSPDFPSPYGLYTANASVTGVSGSALSSSMFVSNGIDGGVFTTETTTVVSSTEAFGFVDSGTNTQIYFNVNGPTPFSFTGTNLNGENGDLFHPDSGTLYLPGSSGTLIAGDWVINSKARTLVSGMGSATSSVNLELTVGTAVPEPTGAGVLGLAIIGLTQVRRKRK